MKLVCISDTHNRSNNVHIPDGDVLVHSGDFTMSGGVKEFIFFAGGLKKLPHENIVVIAGNHDWLAESDPSLAKSIIEGSRPGVKYLHDESVEINGVNFYGSPYTPEFFNWAFNLPRGNYLKDKWDQIPDSTDVLITHGPPHMIGDMVARENSLIVDNAGCVDLARRIRNLPNIKCHVYGHIHEEYGLRTINGVKYANASILNDKYEPVNAPIIIELD